MSMPRFKRAHILRRASGVPSVCENLSDVKKACEFYGIKDSVEYKARYKDIPGLPAHPERVFSEEWISYNDLLDIPIPYSYQELKQLVKKQGCKSQEGYKSFVYRTKDPRAPKDPQTVYRDEWQNWYCFLGKEEPYKTRFIAPAYVVWGEKIDEFMKQALGGGSKITHLCRFVRHYIEDYDESLTPQAFLIQKKVNVKPFKEVLNGLPSENMKRNVIIAVNEFLDFVIEKDLTDEDDETGEVVRVMEARNPFVLMGVDRNAYAPINSESTKPCLQYHFVKKAQSWIIPKGATTFLELKHLQKFDAGWMKVQASLIDKMDPDCVYKKLGSQYFLWSPIDWIHTYTLTCVPLRGRQIAYNDSGEADELIADLDDKGEVIWVKNNISFAGMTTNQSFVKKMPDEHLGMYITTNKTSNQGRGYSIPWIPHDLAYWLVKLRKWQQKYNPLHVPTSWTQCRRTNLNELQLKAKGVNCFLFRAFNDVEPKNVSGALSSTLAATLYHVQPKELALAELSGRENTLGHYKSKYTPHSMRVSLITAYVMEMGMPVEVVMKIVGHSSIVMSIYYCKVTESDIRQRLEEGEKIALKSKAEAVQKLIEQNKLEEVKNQLVSNNSDLLLGLTNEAPAGNFMFRDYGICPYAASRCEDGGDVIGATQVRKPVTAGYLGMQNCIRCRHFITGPAFYGGLLSITNEVLLQANYQSSQCAELQSQIDIISSEINAIERQEYIAGVKRQAFDNSALPQLELKLRKLESEYEGSAKKMDVYLCDLQAAYKLIQMSQAVINEIASGDDSKLSLIKAADAELVLDLREVSYFQQLQEVCENAIVFQSASASNAIAPRSQLLDRMASFNNLAPQMFLMDQARQLEVGHQLVKFLLSRLKTWDRVNEIIECEVKMADLIGAEKISRSEIELITHQSQVSIEC